MFGTKQLTFSITSWPFRKVEHAREDASVSDETLSHLTPRAQQILGLARKEAEHFNHSFVGTEHLLLGLIGLGQGTAVTVLGKLGLDLEKVRREIEQQVGAGPDEKVSCVIPYTPRVKKVLALAAKEARALNHNYVGTEHILLGLLREGDGIAARVLMKLGVDLRKAHREVLQVLDPNFDPAARNAEFSETLHRVASAGLVEDSVDTGKRYDVYCVEGSRHVIYFNALFKGRKSIFSKHEFDTASDFLELEQTDGQRLFVACSSVVKFCEHGLTPRGETVSGDKDTSGQP